GRQTALVLASRQLRRPCAGPVSAMPLIPVERVAWGGYFFSKSLSKARRGSSGRADPDAVSRSTVTCSEKNVHALRAPLLAMRSGTGWVHSKCWPGSKWAHCRQEWSSALHLG